MYGVTNRTNKDLDHHREREIFINEKLFSIQTYAVQKETSAWKGKKREDFQTGDVAGLSASTHKSPVLWIRKYSSDAR